MTSSFLLKQLQSWINYKTKRGTFFGAHYTEIDQTQILQMQVKVAAIDTCTASPVPLEICWFLYSRQYGFSIFAEASGAEARALGQQVPQPAAELAIEFDS